jgi:IPT/TIG domain-containing protein
MVALLAFLSLMLAVAAPADPITFENQYVKVNVLPGWTVDASTSPLLKLTHGMYVLTINPIYTHASGIVGGRFIEAVQGMPSVEAVLYGTDQPGPNCAHWENMVITPDLSLGNMYTDDTKENRDYGCNFPADGKSAWFGSLSGGEGSESENNITLAYESSDLNALPKKGNPELNRVLRDVVAMLKTLKLKPPIVISSIDPSAAPPGAVVTLHGSGFYLPNAGLEPHFVKTPNLGSPPPKVAPDGKSMSFEIPTSLPIVTCKQPGLVNIGENCVPPPANYVDNCPRLGDRETNFCGVPFPPGVYQIEIDGSAYNIHSNAISLIVTQPKPSRVLISTLYPNYLILPDDTITVRGKGFTPTGNTVKIGDAAVADIPSTDAESLTFKAPVPSENSFIPGLYYYKASVVNANGESNSITLVYRYTNPQAVHQYRMWQNQKRDNASSPPKAGH